ncbi:MAG: hypothetical protein GC205_12645 [Bacteroidetes bacterium]|nr:hypothetical protein [Bacteroidota bacterium]
MNLSFLSGAGAFRLGFLAMLLTGAVACKKDKTPEGPEYYMRFRANGVSIEYVQNTFAVFNNTSGLSNASFSGSTIESNMVLQIFWPDTITEGTYTITPGPGSFIPAALFGYAVEGGLLFSSGNTGGDAVINLTEIGPDYARGTFSGVVTETGEPDISITDGVFYLQQP